jgi:hypothetical protein
MNRCQFSSALAACLGIAALAALPKSAMAADKPPAEITNYRSIPSIPFVNDTKTKKKKNRYIFEHKYAKHEYASTWLSLQADGNLKLWTRFENGKSNLDGDTFGLIVFLVDESRNVIAGFQQEHGFETRQWCRVKDGGRERCWKRVESKSKMISPADAARIKGVMWRHFFIDRQDDKANFEKVKKIAAIILSE